MRDHICPMKIKVNGRPTHMQAMEPAEEIVIKNRTQIAPKVIAYLETHDYREPLLLALPVGSGKTYTTIHHVVPWAVERKLQVLFISSRSAINLQVKEELLNVVGLTNLRRQLTDEGLSKQEEFGPVTVMTYHKLGILLQREPDTLKKYGVVVFDEVHALLEDANFVGKTGFILEEFVRVFSGAQRIYMTATPQDIQPVLADNEGYCQLTVMKLKNDFSYVDIHFFSHREQIINFINNDLGDRKWLFFINSIKQGDKVEEKLKHDCCRINAKVREDEPDAWNQIIKARKFDEKVCIMTAAGDAGLSFEDKLLTNIVIYTFSPITLIQVLGRIRRQTKEKINLYVYCPRLEEMKCRLNQIWEMIGILSSFHEHKAAFVSKYILECDPFDLRNVVYLERDGELELNFLALKKCYVEEERISRMIKYGERNKEQYCFERFVCRWLGQPVPDHADSWLDDNISGYAREEFQVFMSTYKNIPMDKEMFENFSKEFQKKCIASFGREKSDRTDRIWGEQKINDKLRMNSQPYELIYDNQKKIYTVKPIENSPKDDEKEE